MQSSYNTYSESQSSGRPAANKPPPSPTMPRSPPAPVPARSSSKEYMRNRSTTNTLNSSNTSTLNSSWQQQQEQNMTSSEQRTTHTLPTRGREEMPKSYLSSAQSTPPHSPRATSPAVSIGRLPGSSSDCITHIVLLNFLVFIFS